MNFRFLGVLLVSLTACAQAETATEHFQDVVTEVKSRQGQQYTYYGIYPGMSRAEALKLAKSGDKVLAAHEDPATKGHFLYEVTDPKMKVSISFPNFGRDIPETRDNADIRSPLITITRIALRNAMFDKTNIFDEIQSELGDADAVVSRGPMHTFYYGYHPQESSKALYAACRQDFIENNPEGRIPKAFAHFRFSDKITIAHIQTILDICPSTIELYKSAQINALSPWLWIKFNEKQRDFSIYMNYQGEDYFSAENPKGPLYEQ
ncbi:hypothetical protein Q7C_1372 [Methylophaga frappieri]|uniref:Lipoprotein n=2 Tax=Methylophaga frappieri (strain ATCC BAA-2434 / DSM 25690 / JAM7) TaxID=754477 RepID=I1YHX9_METFJ|nr:hypothetical protein Q7C_1372 [Methylophaga frappieri]